MQYSKKVIEHFKNPHNQGSIKNADAIGQVGNPSCGDVMKIYLKVGKPASAKATARQVKKGENIIEDIKFETLGCAAAISVSSALTDMAKGKTFGQALKITKDQIVKNLGGLPPIKVHCSMLGVEALHQAIEKYNKK
ncbi:MAG: iron-sulfur cluster assembly scaffold protein [bacterium]|nr:iron-sulfur cluster assembly scaffold protein [bacterium]